MVRLGADTLSSSRPLAGQPASSTAKIPKASNFQAANTANFYKSNQQSNRKSSPSTIHMVRNNTDSSSDNNNDKLREEQTINIDDDDDVSISQPSNKGKSKQNENNDSDIEFTQTTSNSTYKRRKSGLNDINDQPPTSKPRVESGLTSKMTSKSTSSKIKRLFENGETDIRELSKQSRLLPIFRIHIGNYNCEKTTKKRFLIHSQHFGFMIYSRSKTTEDFVSPFRGIDAKSIVSIQYRVDENIKKEMYLITLNTDNDIIKSINDPQKAFSLMNKVGNKNYQLGFSDENPTITFITDQKDRSFGLDHRHVLYQNLSYIAHEHGFEIDTIPDDIWNKNLNENEHRPSRKSEDDFVTRLGNKRKLKSDSDSEDVNDNSNHKNNIGTGTSRNIPNSKKPLEFSESEDEKQDNLPSYLKTPNANKRFSNYETSFVKRKPQPIVPGAARNTQKAKAQEDQAEFKPTTQITTAGKQRENKNRKAKSVINRNSEDMTTGQGSKSKYFEYIPSRPALDPAIANQVYLTKDFDNGSLTIRRGDRATLDPEEYLNDCIVEYGIRLSLMKLRERDPILADQVHLFSSFFYSSLVSAYFNEPSNPYKAIWRWTKSTDIFRKKYILVPICENLHWYLAIIVNPSGTLYGPLQKPEKNQRGKPKPQPRALKRTSVNDYDQVTLKPEETKDKHEEKSKDNKNSYIVELSSDSEDEVEVESKIMEKNTGNNESTESNESNDNNQIQNNDNYVYPHIQIEHNIEKEKEHEHEHEPTQVEIVGNLNDHENNKPKYEYEFDKINENRELNSSTLIFTLDSLGSMHGDVVDNLSRYLSLEANGRKEIPLDQCSEAKGFTAKVPRQPNYCDCGIYVMHYIDIFFRDPIKYIDLMQQSKITKRKIDEEWDKSTATHARDRLVKDIDEAANLFDLEEQRKGKRKPPNVAAAEAAISRSNNNESTKKDQQDNTDKNDYNQNENSDDKAIDNDKNLQITPKQRPTNNDDNTTMNGSIKKNQNIDEESTPKSRKKIKFNRSGNNNNTIKRHSVESTSSMDNELSEDENQLKDNDNNRNGRKENVYDINSTDDERNLTNSRQFNDNNNENNDANWDMIPKGSNDLLNIKEKYKYDLRQDVNETKENVTSLLTNSRSPPVTTQSSSPPPKSQSSTASSIMSTTSLFANETSKRENNYDLPTPFLKEAPYKEMKELSVQEQSNQI